MQERKIRKAQMQANPTRILNKHKKLTGLVISFYHGL